VTTDPYKTTEGVKRRGSWKKKKTKLGGDEAIPVSLDLQKKIIGGKVGERGRPFKEPVGRMKQRLLSKGKARTLLLRGCAESAHDFSART